MKTNRSMKDLRIQTHRFQEEREVPVKLHIPTSPNINIDSISTVLKNLHQQESHKTLKQSKFTQSHSRLEVPTAVRIQAVSPKYLYTEIKTERNREKTKGHENVEISAFDLGKQSKVQDSSRRILRPSNRNTYVQEPKRPKILTKLRPPTFFEEFRVGKVLGKGRFGSVYVVQHNLTKFVAAVKQISLEKVSSKLIERLVYEIKIQSFAKHENILQLYKCYKEGNNLYLVIELGAGSLFDRLRQKRFFSQSESASYIEQTIKALIYLHSNGVIHRDLKPENIVLIDNVVKLADFGWSIYIGNNSKRKTFCGTLDYVSPEIVMGSEYDQMVDVWSVGVLCYELCTGHAPFESSKSREETYRKILNVDLKFPRALSEDVKDFIRRLLIKKPEDRMSLEEALEHPWIKKYCGR